MKAVNEKIVKCYPIVKIVSDSFGTTKYEAKFYTDNKFFVKCELSVLDGCLGMITSMMNAYDLYFSRTVKCRDGDTFNSYVGHSLAIEKCLERLHQRIIKYNFGETKAIPYIRVSNPGKGKKSKWDRFDDHITEISERFDKTLSEVCGGKN